MDIAFTTKQQVAEIIGIVCTATGGGAGTWQRVDENFDAITTTAATFNNHPERMPAWLRRPLMARR